jgi:hypothetical protein
MRKRRARGKSKAGYARRTRELKRRYGSNIFERWGKKGGNPILLRQGRRKRRRARK